MSSGVTWVIKTDMLLKGDISSLAAMALRGIAETRADPP
jgi:hypothetical protein